MLYSTLIVALVTAQGAQGPIGPTPGPSFASPTVPGRIAGTVTADGKPVAGAAVFVFRRRYPLAKGVSKLARELLTTETTTDADGRYTVEVPAWRNLLVYAKKGNLISKVATEVSWPDKRVLPLELGEPWNVACDLLYAGKPLPAKVAFKLVRISPRDENPPLTIAGESDEQGHIRVENIPDGPWQLKLSGAKWRLTRPKVLSNLVTSGALGPMLIPSAEVEDAITLTGQLQTVAGAPIQIAGVRIETLDTMHESEATTDDEGRFTLTGLQRGPGTTVLIDGAGVVKTVLATPPGLRPEDPAPQFPLRLRKNHGYAGRIIDASGNPVANANVLVKGFVHQVGITVEDMSIPLRTDDNGRFRADGLDIATTYNLTVIAENGEEQPIRSITGADAGNESFRLGGRRAQIGIEWAGGVAATKPFRVDVYGPRETGTVGDRDALAQLSQNAFITPCLLEGTYTAIVSSPEIGVSMTEFKIAAGSDTAHVHGVIRCARAKQLKGVVVDASGRAVADREIRVGRATVQVEGGGSWVDMVVDRIAEDMFPKDQYPTKVKTDKDGKFTIWNLEPTRPMELIVQAEGANAGNPEMDTRVPIDETQAGEIKIVAR